MILQIRHVGVDSQRMIPTPISTMNETTDQDLVNLYANHAGVVPAIRMTESQIYRASHAAYVLELRGYFEQAGFWVHDSRPALQATA
jgi:hypothetical protein